MANWVYLVYLSVLPITATASIGLAAYVWRRRQLPAAIPFFLLTLTAAWWAMSHAFGLIASTFAATRFWLLVQQVSIAAIPVIWIAFTFRHLGMSHWMTRRRLGLLSIIPLLTVILAWTNEHHHLMWHSITLKAVGPLSVLVLEHAPWFWVAVAYSYALLLVSVYLMVRRARGPGLPLYRRKAILPLLTVLLPLVGNALYVFQPALLSYLDPTPLLFLPAVMAFVWGLSDVQMLDVMLAARNAVVDWMSDGVVIVDMDGRIRDLNPSACRFFRCDMFEAIGRPCGEILPAWEEWVAQGARESPEFRAELNLEGPNGERLCEVRVSPFYDRRHRAIGHLLVLRDITEQKHTEEMLYLRERFLRCVAEVSQLLLKESNLAVSLPQVLRHIGETAGVCRVVLFENHSGPNGELLCSIRYEWMAEGVPSLMEHPAATNLDYVANGLRDWMELLSWGEIIIKQGDELPPLGCRNLGEHEIRAVLLIPLFVFDSWHGFVGLHICDQEREWLPEEISLLRVAAGDIASSIERDLSRSRSEALTEAVAAITSTLEFEQILDRILEQVGRVIPNDAANVMLVEDGNARIVRWRGYERFGVEDFVARLVLPLDSTPNLRRMADTREPMVIPDTHAYAEWVRIPEQEWLRSYASAPIVVRDEVVGFLNVDSAIPGFFSVEHLAPLRTFAGYAAAAIENARLFDSLRHRVTELEAIRRAGLALASSLDLHTVLEIILHNTFVLLDDVFDAHIFLYDDDQLTFGAAMWADGESKEPWAEPRPNGLTYNVARGGKTIVVPDISKHPLFADVSPQWEGAIVGLPLTIGSRVVGVMNVAYHQPRTFSEAELDALRSLADQAAVAIENARLFQAEQRQTRRLALLADIANIIASTLDADEMLQQAAQSVQRHFPYKMVMFFLVMDDEKSLLQLRGYAGTLEADDVSDEALLTPGLYIQSVEVGVVGHTVRTGKPYYAPDTLADPHYFYIDSWARSELCVPIVDEGGVIGALDVESDQLDAFDEYDISLLEAVADTIATGLRNVRLYEESRRRVRELTLLNQISARLGESRDVDEIINAVLEGVYELLDLDRAFFITADRKANRWWVSHEKLDPELRAVLGTQATFDDVAVEAGTLMSGQPFVASSVEADPRLARDLYRALKIQSLVLVPVRVKTDLRGALGAATGRRQHTWQPDEVRLLEGMAHQLELALENATLIEEAYRRNAELEDALARQEELDRLKDEFIQNVSHELRTPLALILGYAEMLAAGDLGELRPEQQKPVEIISRRSRMLSRLVEDITLILEAEASPPDPQIIHLGQLALDAVDDFQVAAERAGLTLTAEVSPDLPPVRCVPTYLRRVLDNLLGNAAKFTPEGGRITLRVWQDGEYIALAVSDTGVGIPPDKLERIFERFYQVDGSARRKYGGVGLGLALVKEIAEAYGGRVDVESTVGQGSTFTVWLPAVAEVTRPSATDDTTEV